MDINKNMQEMYCQIQYLMAGPVLESLNKSGINYAVVKGCPLSYYKTGRPGGRLSSDIDILISRQDVNQLTEILYNNGFMSSHEVNRKEKIMLLSHSHQIPPFYKCVGTVDVQIDINFDLFWGEYIGKRIDISDFLCDSVTLEFWGHKVKTLPPLKMMLQLILHHYKEMNSLYHLTSHVAVHKRLFEDVYLLCQQFPNDISPQNLYEACKRFEILPYAYYLFYYARRIYESKLLDAYLEVLWTGDGELLLDYYGLSEKERKKWKIPFEKRLNTNVSKLIYNEMSDGDIKKLEQNRRLFG